MGNAKTGAEAGPARSFEALGNVWEMLLARDDTGDLGVGDESWSPGKSSGPLSESETCVIGR